MLLDDILTDNPRWRRGGVYLSEITYYSETEDGHPEVVLNTMETLVLRVKFDVFEAELNKYEQKVGLG